MKRVGLQLLLIVFLFCGTWFILSRVDWMSLLSVEKTSKKTEEKLGDFYWSVLKKTEIEIHSDSVVSVLDTLLNRICIKNGIKVATIKLHLVQKNEINAFALPNRHLVVYSGLINACENESELCGILGHEIAHMERNHIMKKLVKEVGLSALLSLTAGNAGSEIAKKTIRLLSSSAYDRKLETEADLLSADYLIKAGIDPESFANFLYRFGIESNHLPDQLSWISTHPDSEERAKEIVSYIKDKEIQKRPVLSNREWNLLKAIAVDVPEK